jgi:hypothetical protein
LPVTSFLEPSRWFYEEQRMRSLATGKKVSLHSFIPAAFLGATW